jgi:hypothetical protein
LQPFKIADYFLQHADEWPERAERARAVIESLGDCNRDEWARIAASNVSVKTTLRSLGRVASARLLHHAYVTAMANLHVILNYPLLDVPALDRFEGFVK